MSVAGLEDDVYNGRPPATFELLAIEREEVSGCYLSLVGRTLVAQKPVNNVNPYANFPDQMPSLRNDRSFEE